MALTFTIIGIIIALYLAGMFEKPKTETITYDDTEEKIDVSYGKLCCNIDALIKYKEDMGEINEMIRTIENYNERDLTNIKLTDSNGRSCNLLVNNKSDILKSLYSEKQFIQNNINKIVKELGGN